MKLHAVGFVFARGGSKGLPRKNIRLLAGKPLIAHAIETVLQSQYIRRVVVSTDDYEIAHVARQFGAEVPFMRPAELAGDNSPELHAWRHALQMVQAEAGTPQVDVFVSVPATAPLRTVDDVDRCVEALLASDADMAITVSESRRNPYYSMVTVDEQQIARVVISGSGPVVRRQEAPRVYDIVPCAYAARPSYVMRAGSVLEGKITAVEIPEERAIDIDCELDFQMAELLFRNRATTPLPARKAG